MLSIDDLARNMLTCEQTQGQTVYAHGVSVREHFFDLLEHLNIGKELYEWKLPEWLQTYREEILENLWDQETISLYTLYHDCGKPHCREIDKDGKVHFPNHAEVSRQVWLESRGSEIVGNLIGWDMVIHTASSKEIEDFCNNEWSVRDAITLLIAALAEVHSNAKLFGGIESISFKSKFKKVDRRGRQILKHFFGEKQ